MMQLNSYVTIRLVEGGP